jgi:hypothetical protein
MLSRLAAWTLLAGAGFGLAAAPAAARQDKELPDRPAGLFEDVNKLRRDGNVDAKKAQPVFTRFAEYHAKLISSPAVYRAGLDFRPDPKVPSLDKIVDDLTGRIAVPEIGSRTGTEQVEYIKGLGAALDAALVKVIDQQDADPIVRINAARLLAVAARSGAPAHYPSVTRLIADRKTPPEVKFYILKAADGLLAAYDPAASILDQQTKEALYQSRKHSAPLADVTKLVKEVEQAVLNPAVLLGVEDKDKAFSDIRKVPEDQRAVVQYLRRQAIRALAQVRSPSIESADGTVYPAFTLARITLGDPALVLPPYTQRPAPPELGKKEEVDSWLALENARQRAAAGRRAAEAAEATLGLCNMWKNQEYAPDAAAYAVAAGLVAFANPRIGNPTDKTIPWRSYAARLHEAVRNWELISRPGFDPQRGAKSPFRGPAPEPVRKVVAAATREDGLLPQMEKAGPDGASAGTPTPGRDELNNIRSELNKAAARPWLLFPGNPATSVDIQPAAAPPPPKKK